MEVDSRIFVAAVAAMLPAMACVWAGMRHVVAPQGLAAAIQQVGFLRTLPSKMVHWAARAWGMIEMSSGLAVAALLLSQSAPRAVRFGSLIWLTMMCTIFTIWVALLWRLMPGSICGCTSYAEPADGLAFARSLVLTASAATGLGLMLPNSSAAVIGDLQHWLFAMLLGGTLAILVLIWPGAVRTVHGQL